MARHFREPERRQVFLLPADMMDWLPEGDIVPLIVEAVAMMDLGEFEADDKLGRAGQARLGRAGIRSDEGPPGRSPVQHARARTLPRRVAPRCRRAQPAQATPGVCPPHGKGQRTSREKDAESRITRPRACFCTFSPIHHPYPSNLATGSIP